MRNLAPMIRLDLANLANWRRAALPVLGALIFMTWANGMQMAVVLLYLGCYLLCLNPFTVDDRFKVPQLYGSLPVTRRTVITSHYVIAVGAVLGTVALIPAVAWLSHLTTRNDFTTEALGGLAGLLISALFFSALLPLTVRLGPQATSYAFLGLMVVFALATMLLRGPAKAFDMRWLVDLIMGKQGTTVVFLAIAVLIAWGLSYLLAVRWYEAKDF